MASQEQIEVEVQEVNAISSISELDSKIGEIAHEIDNRVYVMGALISKRMQLTPVADHKAFYSDLERKYQIKRSTASEYKLVAETYSYDEWKEYVDINGLTYSHLLSAAKYISDPKVRADELNTAIDEGLTANAFAARLKELYGQKEYKKPLQFVKLSGKLVVVTTDDGASDIAVMSEEGEQSLSEMLEPLVGRSIEISIKWNQNE